MSSRPSLRSEHAELTRERILRTVAELLEQEPLSDISVPGIARQSGVSLRTIYRYYPTREELLAAAGEWLGEHVWEEPEFPRSVAELVRHLEPSCQRFEEHAALVRAMVLSAAGREVRSPRRLRRREALNVALAEVSDRLPRGEVERAAAVLFYLDSMEAWLAIGEESGLDSRQIGKALSWAIATLIEDLRRRNESAKQSND